jgi:hypothetical protein
LFLVSLVALLVYLFSPHLVLQIRTDMGARLFCAPISSGDEIVYHSTNSIYRVPVEEYLRVEDDGGLTPEQVISTPDVMYYYGIEEFERVDDVRVRASPRETRFREVRIKVGRAGPQTLVVRGQNIALYELAGEGEAVTIATRQTPRAFTCW